jgi:hypothetical protein
MLRFVQRKADRSPAFVLLTGLQAGILVAGLAGRTLAEAGDRDSGWCGVQGVWRGLRITDQAGRKTLSQLLGA